MFCYDIVTTWAERFTFTANAGPTSTGKRTVTDQVNNVACEYKRSGIYSGYVYCVDFDATLANVQNGYKWRYGIEETCGGSWISPTTGNAYAMKGLRTVAPNDSIRAVVACDDGADAAKLGQNARRGRIAESPDPEAARIIDEMCTVLKPAKQ